MRGSAAVRAAVATPQACLLLRTPNKAPGSIELLLFIFFSSTFSPASPSLVLGTAEHRLVDGPLDAG